MEDNWEKMEDDHKNIKWKTTSKEKWKTTSNNKMKDELPKKWKQLFFLNGRRPRKK